VDNLAAPWLSLQTLAATDAPTLASLRQRCHALSAELGIDKRQYSGLVWAAAVLALVGGAALVWLLAAGRSPRDWPALQALARFVTANPLVGLTLAVPLAAASLYLFARYFRS